MCVRVCADVLIMCAQVHVRVCALERDVQVLAGGHAEPSTLAEPMHIACVHAVQCPHNPACAHTVACALVRVACRPWTMGTRCLAPQQSQWTWSH